MVRRFKPDALPRDVLERILESGLHAPSAGFSQGLRLVVLDTPALVEQFWRTTIPADSRDALVQLMPVAPPVIVLPCTHKQAYLDRYGAEDKKSTGMASEDKWPMPFWYIDAGMSVMLMLMTAVDEGVGAWFFGIFNGEDQLLSDLGVASGWRPIGAIALGYPASDDRKAGSAATIPRRRLEEVVQYGSVE